MGDDKTQALMKVLKFSEVELQANRKGDLSDRQKRSIRNIALISLSAFALVGLFFSTLLLISVKRPLTENVVVVAGLLGGAFVLIGVLLFWLHLRDCKDGAVKRAFGVIKIQHGKRGYVLRVDDVQLPIVSDLGELVEKDLTYNVYYLPSIRQIVSLERASIMIR